MSTLERRLGRIRATIHSRLNPEGNTESAATKVSSTKDIAVNPAFILDKLTELKTPNSIVRLKEFSVKRSILKNSVDGENKPLNLDEQKQENIYNPQSVLDKLNNVNRTMLRIRRSRSRCRNRGPHKHGECGSPYCKVSKTMEEFKKASEQPIAVLKTGTTTAREAA